MRVIQWLLRRVRRDDGFTLIELVISVAILGVIAAALFGIVLQYLKVSTSTQTRLSESTDQQFVSTYWQTDVSSLGRRSFNPDDTANPISTQQSVWVGAAAPNGCGSSVSGDVVVSFAWTDFAVGVIKPVDAWKSTAQEVAYVAVWKDPQWVLKRVRCHGTTAGQPITVAHNLTVKPLVTCNPEDCGSGLPKTVSIKLTVQDKSGRTDTGYTTTLTADRRQG